jgi:hypothetical protein
MPGDSGATAVNTRVHVFTTHSHARLPAHWAPGIPHALRGGSSWNNSGAARREGANACLEFADRCADAGYSLFYSVMARSSLVRRSSKSEGGCDEAIQLSSRCGMDCFADARNDRERAAAVPGRRAAWRRRVRRSLRRRYRDARPIVSGDGGLRPSGKSRRATRRSSAPGCRRPATSRRPGRRRSI